MISKRNLLRGLFAAPAIIAIDRLMPVKLIVPHIPIFTKYKGIVRFDAAIYYCPYIPIKILDTHEIKDYIIKHEPLIFNETRIYML